MDLQAFLIGLAVFAILACLLYPEEIRGLLRDAAAWILDEPLDEESEFGLPGERIDKARALEKPRSTLLMFGSSTCPHCGGALEALREIAGERIGEDIFVYELGSKSTAEVATAYKIKHVPAFVWVDKDGGLTEMEGGGFDALKAFVHDVCKDGDAAPKPIDADPPPKPSPPPQPGPPPTAQGPAAEGPVVPDEWTPEEKAAGHAAAAHALMVMQEADDEDEGLPASAPL